jgi:DNA-binding transcriptional ArsR family regulator
MSTARRGERRHRHLRDGRASRRAGPGGARLGSDEDGALPASELATRAGIARLTASEHLARLLDGNLLVAVKRGRHRYFELADPTVAQAVEALSVIAPPREIRSLCEANQSERIRAARTCYDHLAGGLGVAVARPLESRGALARENGGYALGAGATEAVAVLDIDLELLACQRRPLVRACLDWSEREPHVAGALGAAITLRLFELGCIERRKRTRAVAVTDRGRDFLRHWLGIDTDST